MMTKTEAVGYMTDIVVESVGYGGKVPPDDVTEKLKELRVLEIDGFPKTIHGTMFRNQELTAQLDCPCCRDTGVLQYLVKCDTRFPFIDFVESLSKEATARTTFDIPLRRNSVEALGGYNTDKNVGRGTPTVFWEIAPERDIYEIYSYMVGGGCLLPGKAMVLMPGQGHEGITKFVLDVATSYGSDARPPLLMGAGVATSIEAAVLLSEKTLFRTLGSKNSNGRAAKLEELLEDGTDEAGLRPQGVPGKVSVIGVYIENTARHPSTMGVAVDVGCWSYKKGHIISDKDLKCTTISRKGVTL